MSQAIGTIAVLSVALAMLIAGCAAPLQVAPSAREQAQSYAAGGDYNLAAQTYLDAARAAAPPARQELEVRAAEAWYTAGARDEARAVLAAIDFAGADPVDRVRGALLRARLALDDGRPDLALEVLSPVPPAPPALEAEIRLARARAFEALDRPLDAVRERSLRATVLEGSEALADNERALWADLGPVSSGELESARASTRDRDLTGWIDLALSVRQAGLAPEALARALAEWERQYPGHPAAAGFAATLHSEYQAAEVPRHVAVLLPLEGRYQAAGSAIRDGLLMAYYGDPRASRPTLRIYDTASESVVTVYRRAVEAGADAVIGPLVKETIAVLAQAQTLSVPVLALNRVDVGRRRTPNLFQFGLAPEDEARGVANRARAAGMSRAAVLVPQGDWGERVGAAFRAGFEVLGGEIVADAEFDPQMTDYSELIRRIMHLDRSDARHAAVQDTVGLGLNFVPRHRRDVDFIFLGAFPRHARLIVPQLQFHYVTDVPIFATSHVYAGVEDPGADRDLDGLEFCDIPWMVGGGLAAGERTRVESLWPQSGGAMIRLYALGYDAYHLLTYLPRMRTETTQSLPGATGNLYADGSGRIWRELAWARFVNGQARSVDTTTVAGTPPLPLENP